MMNQPRHLEAVEIVQQGKRQTRFLGDAEKAVKGGPQIEQDR
jgi:hypothetical protein